MNPIEEPKNMREKMLKQLLYIYSDNDMSPAAKEKKERISDYIKGFSGKEIDEDADCIIYDLVDAVFMDSANMVVDALIRGSEVA